MICESCGDNSGKYNLCKKCYYLFKDGKLIKCEKCGKWHSPNSNCESSSAQSNDAQQSQKFIYNPKPSLITETENCLSKYIIKLVQK